VSLSCAKQPRTRSLDLKRTIACGLFVLGAAYLRAQITVTEPIPQNVVIDVDAAQTVGEPIPRTIFGSFLEPIGNSTYNGLWAEIIENPSFESGLWSPQKIADMLRERPELRQAGDVGLPLPWEPLDPRQGNRYELHYGEASNSFQSLSVLAVPGEHTGIRQKVYLPIHRTREYQGSLYAKHLSGADAVTIAIHVRDREEVLASQDIHVADPEWKKYAFTLQLPEGKLHRLDPVDFVLQLAGDERVEVDQVSLMPSDAINGLDPDEVSFAKAMHTPLVRFGGNFTSSYHWRDGIGPRDKRVSMLNHSWGIPEYNTFGTDEFLAFCRLIGAEPQVALNLGSGTAEEAAGWVRYVNEHWTTHSGLLWELGNELWGNWNLGYPTRDQLAARTLEFSKSIREADPEARLIATGQDPEVFKEWNATQLTNPPGTFNYLSTHFVVGTGNIRAKTPGPDFIAAAAFALPVELERRVQDEQKQIDGTAGYAGKAHVAFTEWLFIGERRSAPSFTNLGGAIITGGFFNMLMRNSAIVPISDMTGIMEFAGIWKKRSQVYATPAYYVFKMYAGAKATQRISASANSGAYSVTQGVDRLPEITNVPYLDVVATMSQDARRVTLFCVNRSLDTDIASTIRLQHFDGGGIASVQVLRSASINDLNDEINPGNVEPVDSAEPIPAGAWTHVFPHESVTVIAVDRK
jgi:alpha-L-arabinofuranosidase